MCNQVWGWTVQGEGCQPLGNMAFNPRSVLAAVIDGITGEVFRPRLTPSNEPVISCG